MVLRVVITFKTYKNTKIYQGKEENSNFVVVIILTIGCLFSRVPETLCDSMSTYNNYTDVFSGGPEMVLWLYTSLYLTDGHFLMLV